MFAEVILFSHFRRKYRFAFFHVSRLKSLDISAFPSRRCMIAFSLLLLYVFLSYVGEFLFFVTRVVNNTVHCHYHCESINVFKALRFHFVPQNAKKLRGIRRKTAE